MNEDYELITIIDDPTTGECLQVLREDGVVQFHASYGRGVASKQVIITLTQGQSEMLAAVLVD